MDQNVHDIYVWSSTKSSKDIHSAYGECFNCILRRRRDAFHVAKKMKNVTGICGLVFFDFPLLFRPRLLFVMLKTESGTTIFVSALNKTTTCLFIEMQHVVRIIVNVMYFKYMKLRVIGPIVLDQIKKRTRSTPRDVRKTRTSAFHYLVNGLKIISCL